MEKLILLIVLLVFASICVAVFYFSTKKPKNNSLGQPSKGGPDDEDGKNQIQRPY
jgi:flagellar basal body-associated protein FliL